MGKTSRLEICALTVLACILAHSVHAEDLANGKLRIGWTSSNSHFDGLNPEVDDLYVSLRNRGILPVKTMEVPARTSLPSEYFSGMFVHSDWTSKVDNLLCDLNPDKCSRPRQPAVDLSDANTHVSGFQLSEPEKSSWTLKPGDKVIVPDLKFTVEARWVDLPLDPDSRQNLADLYEKNALGCQAALNGGIPLEDGGLSLPGLKARLAVSEGTACPEAIFESNVYDFGLAIGKRSKAANIEDQAQLRQRSLEELRAVDARIREAGSAGESWSHLERFARTALESNRNAEPPTISLPVAGLASSFTIDAANASQSASTGVGSDAWHRSLQVTVPQAAITEDMNSSFVVRSVEEKSGWTVNQADTTAAAATTGSINEADLPGLMIRKPVQVAEADLFSPSTVVVVDKGLDLTLCILKPEGCGGQQKVQVIDLDDPSQNDPDDYPDPARMAELFRAEKEHSLHGTQVAALVGARSGGYGIDPNAKIVPFEMDFGAPWKLDNIQTLKSELKLSGPVVWNLSGHTLTRNAVLGIARYATEKAQSESRYLFVVSAGNLSEQEIQDNTVTDPCGIFPACLVSSSNPVLARSIISVVGVMKDDQGKIVPWDNGEFGSLYNAEFQIAAPANGFVLPSADPAIAFRGSGVSFAVPLVSGTLSAMRSRETIASSMAVGRLIGCGVQYTTLDGKVKGGLLDSSCAVDFTHDHVSFTKDISGTEKDIYKQLRSGRVEAIWNGDMNDQVREFPMPDTNTEISGTYRLYPDENRDSILGYRQFGDDPDLYKLAVWDEADDRIRTESINALKSSLVVEFLPEGSTESVCFPVSSITNFIPKNFNRFADEEKRRRPKCKH